MSALPAEQPLEIDTARIYQLPPREDVPNPILEATPEAYQPPPDVILNRPKAKRQRKAKGTGKKPGRPKKPEPTAEAPTAPPAPPAQQLATPPHGDALPKFNSENVFTLMTIVWLVVGFGSGVGACYLMWGPVL